jgi:hypothetical protein
MVTNTKTARRATTTRLIPTIAPVETAGSERTRVVDVAVVVSVEVAVVVPVVVAVEVGVIITQVLSCSWLHVNFKSKSGKGQDNVQGKHRLSSLVRLNFPNGQAAQNAVWAVDPSPQGFFNSSPAEQMERHLEQGSALSLSLYFPVLQGMHIGLVVDVQVPASS